MYILVIILVIIIIPLIGAVLLPKEFVIEREITITKSHNEVFDFVKILKNQTHYNKWIMTDPNQKLEYKGTEGTVGFIMAWDSAVKSAGKGEQEIINITDGKRLDYTVRFEKPFKNTAGSYIITDSLSSHQTIVKLAFTGSRTYVQKIMHFMLNLSKTLGKDLQISLENLKSVLEK